MSDVLTQNQGALAIAESWEERAQVVEKFHPESDAARTLRRCAETLRRFADETAPDEVPLTVVRDRTGWSESWLLERVKQFAEEGRARKRGRTWWIDRDSALRIPVKRGHRPTLHTVDNLEEMAERILDMQAS